MNTVLDMDRPPRKYVRVLNAETNSSGACSYRSVRERRGVLVGASQSEREEETRD
jgi:hypothetical protein